jgi:hypothetical protein
VRRGEIWEMARGGGVWAAAGWNLGRQIYLGFLTWCPFSLASDRPTLYPVSASDRLTL